MLGVTAAECSASNSVVTHGDSGRSITYGQIVADGNIDRSFSEEEYKAISLKKFGEYKVVGKPVAALDIPAKVNGSAGYGIDVFLPGMVYARWLSPPVRYGATPKSVDDSAAKSVDGYIKTIMVPGTSMQNGYALAIAETKHAVDAAAATIQVEWEHGQFANISSESLLQESRKLIDDKDAYF